MKDQIQPKCTVFIIHGRDTDYKKLKKYLNEECKCVINAIVLEDEFIPGRTIPEKLEHIASQAVLAIALMTPDDVGSIQNDEIEFRDRARQNVLIEIGWFWGRLGRDRILILRKGSIEIPSDLQGVDLPKYSTLDEEVLSRICDILCKECKELDMDK